MSVLSSTPTYAILRPVGRSRELAQALTLHRYDGTGTGGLNSSIRLFPDSANWGIVREITAGDFNGDGNSDLLAVQESTGTLRLYLGDGKGDLADGVTSGILNWSTIKDIIPGDFSGDGKTDLAAIWGDGTLHLYTGSGTGSFTSTGTMWPDATWATTKLAT
ncbi:VCBS repeat-containing protein [Streptomyces sp. HPF1205]|uniref:FG-GAP repeat domain-containing protein n=1 Tax=Streptomyces sp. HPF1205 TaxID=2873262 RepID=UPI001CEC8556|nr:VCBS repeat-containing protein [Streptomyces sp. HPF1205]